MFLDLLRKFPTEAHTNPLKMAKNPKICDFRDTVPGQGVYKTLKTFKTLKMDRTTLKTLRTWLFLLENLKNQNYLETKMYVISASLKLRDVCVVCI